MRHIAVLPSNQSRNLYPAGQSEQQVMGALGERVLGYLRQYGGDVQSLLVKGTPDSADAWPLQGLYRQMDTAVQWLRTAKVAPRDGAILSLHSDSGTPSNPEWSHILGCYGGEIGGASWTLADAVSSGLESVIQTGDRRLWDYSGYVFYARAGGYPSALVETGCHQSPHDVYYLLNRQDDLAEAITAAVLGYFEVSPIVTVPVVTPAEVYFASRGVAANPATAIYRYWRAAFDAGDLANLGPAMAPEEDGAPYGEGAGAVVQRFTNGIVVSKPSEGWRCYRCQVVLEPRRWKLCPN